MPWSASFTHRRPATLPAGGPGARGLEGKRILSATAVSRKWIATGLIATGATLGLVCAGTGPVEASPRMTLDQCAAETTNPESDYTVIDSSDNTKCVTNPDGTFVYVWDAVITKGEYARGNVQLYPTTGKAARGDARRYARVYFIRGDKVLKKKVLIGSDGFVKFRRKLNQAGTWAVIVTRGGRTISTTIQVNS